MFRGEQVRNGVAIEYGSIDEMLAFSAWSRQRILMLQAVKAMTLAPLDAARAEGGADATMKAFRGFAHDLWPELAAQEAAVMAHQKSLLDRVRHSPIRLAMQEGPGGTLSVSMDAP